MQIDCTSPAQAESQATVQQYGSLSQICVAQESQVVETGLPLSQRLCPQAVAESLSLATGASLAVATAADLIFEALGEPMPVGPS